MPTIDDSLVGRVPYVFEGGPDGARTLLGTIAGAMISVTGLVFSVTIVVLQLASSQFTPRIIPQFLSSRITQVTLGFFMATFIYSLTVMRAVRGGNEEIDTFVPEVAITLAFVLVLVSVGCFLAFIHNITSSIQVSQIVSRLGESTVALIDQLYPAAATGAARDGDEHTSAMAAVPHHDWSPRPGAHRTDVTASNRHGVVTAIDYPRLVDAAGDVDAVIVIDVDLGQFIAEGHQFATVWAARELDPSCRRLIERSFHLGGERSMVQDVAFGFRQLVDIAERALSPGINDPTTASQIIDELHRSLRRLVGRPAPSPNIVSDEGHLRVVHRRATFQSLLDLAVDEIAHYGKDSLQIPRRLHVMLDDLRQCAQPSNVDAIDNASQRVRDMTGPGT
ncbi:DUF2254 domain-containing protein [Janibacter alittae]